ncbi:MAG TPA: tRNA (adenosine(37)-N6)-dimethylallyltransferase MiaA [Rectinemataceae bacterium]|nr:tRNA (adenosine(37)-N6)-dimethylallyltransferase MiaA [Rectinemataceae bacterium]
MSTASSNRPLVLVLCGPTASGKTALLEELFAAKGPDGKGLGGAEIVSADSMQAYRGMDIGTAKPAPELLGRLPHHLIDILEPSEQYTAGDFVRLADEACETIVSAGRLPVVSGGTGFYIRNFICGLPAAPKAESGLREAVAADLVRLGRAALRAELASLDPASAARIHENDEYRLTRALEIVRATGRPCSDFAPGLEPRRRWRFLVAAVERPRPELFARIDARVEAMFEAGLEAEVAGLIAKGFGPEAPGMKAIGYREFLEAGEGEPKERVKLDTRRYAKRQMTFFRALPGVSWIPPEASALASLLRESQDKA